MKRMIIAITLVAAAMAGCASETETADSEPIVDVFEQGGRTLEVTATPMVDDSFDIALSYSSDMASYTATFNAVDADLSDNEELAVVLSQLDETFLLHIQGILLAREIPRNADLARWHDIENSIFGYVQGDEAEYASCFFGTGNWEYCGGSGMYHCCVFDHGCGWLCSIFY
jgi:hypothetical protein